MRFHHLDTVETLYSTIYYSKYFIELNFDKSTQYVALWTLSGEYFNPFVSISTEIDRVIKGFYCIGIYHRFAFDLDPWLFSLIEINRDNDVDK